ncbi:MAG: DUF4190 domain-containing protein [Phycisphaerales bacterium]|nr:DUF4190 domain-containing protein [Phycisphaerales bacterium]
MFGRESEQHRQRADRFRAWCHARSGLALASAFLGFISLPDCVIVVPGIAAIVTGILGLRDLKRRPHLTGARLCYFGIVCGSFSLLFAAVVYSSRYW